MTPRLSCIVPFHSGLPLLERCLRALAAGRPEGSELIVAADAPVDACAALAARFGARVVEVAPRPGSPGPAGPAAARNAAAAVARGDVLVFVDADVVVSPGALARLAATFVDRPALAAVFGAYDERPAHPGFMSQYKNLSHAFIHRSSAARAKTFWAGCGAVRRHAFAHVGGFDERFARPSVEDIDFGYRLTRAGFEVALDPGISACHLKRWTVGSAIVSDVRDRGIPWTQLLLRYGAPRDDLNLRAEYRWSVAIAYLAVALLALSPRDARLLAAAAIAFGALALLNRRYYGYFYRVRGAWFAVRAWALHTLHHLYNGVSFAVGLALFAAARYLGLRLPGALPVEAWSASK